MAVSARRRPPPPDDLEQLLALLREVETSRDSGVAGNTVHARGRGALARLTSMPADAGVRRARTQASDDNSLQLLDRLLPVLHAVLHKLAATREAEIETVALRVLCNWMRLPVYVIDSALGVRFRNSAAEAVGVAHGVRVKGGAFSLTDRRQLARLAALVATRPAAGGKEATHDLGALAGGRKLHVRACTLGSGDVGDVLWFVLLPDAAADPLARWRACGLTEAESRVAALVAAGRRPQQVATDLDVSINTVRSHLKTVFAKLNVHTQAGLVRLGLGDHPL